MIIVVNVEGTWMTLQCFLCDYYSVIEKPIAKTDIKKATGLSIDKSIANTVCKKPENHEIASSGDTGDAGPAAKKQKVDNTASGLHKDSEWMGVTIGSDASTYSFVLEITSLEDNKENFSGTIKWPTLGKGVVTKVRGTVKGDEVKFEEYEAVTGADDVELPMFYTGKLVGDKLNGKLKDSTGEESSFNLSKIKSKSAQNSTIHSPQSSLSPHSVSTAPSEVQHHPGPELSGTQNSTPQEEEEEETKLYDFLSQKLSWTKLEQDALESIGAIQEPHEKKEALCLLFVLKKKAQQKGLSQHILAQTINNVVKKNVSPFPIGRWNKLHHYANFLASLEYISMSHFLFTYHSGTHSGTLRKEFSLPF